MNWPGLLYRKPRKRLFISFSGGRTSAAMTYTLLRQLDPDEWEVVVLFANTGQEHEETLRFVDRCDRILGFATVWLEVVVDPRPGKPSTFKIVTFETASRSGEPFEAVIAKHGIPNQAFPACTRETKLRALTKYLRAIGWEPGSYYTAIGLRADELDRVSPSAEVDKVIYPYAGLGVRKAHVLEFWRSMPFDLYIPEHLGNCVWCWKKSLRKLLTIAKDEPAAFDFPRQMEERHPFAGPGNKAEPKRFFRGNRTVADLIAMAASPFEPFVDGNEVFDPELDVGGACGETCEVMTDGAA